MELFKSRTRVAYTNAVGDKVYPVIVDIKRGIKSTEEIQFMSSDINTGILSVAFIQGNDNYNVSGAEVVCSVMRPDASTLDIPCTIVENNIVEVPLGINGTSQDGIYSFDFKVFKGGNKVVGTPIMNYSVSLSISNDMVVEEDDRLPVLTMLMTQLTDLKGEARETINQANAATVSSREATANAIAATNNANAVSERVSQETSEAISRVDNKVNEVETRFNALTSSQQQDAEVIDARDGETSLKARLDRDIEKTNKELDKIKKLEESTVSTVETESDFTTVEATSNGYFEDVKLEGKTLVNLYENKAKTYHANYVFSPNERVNLDLFIPGNTYTAIVHNSTTNFDTFRISSGDITYDLVPLSKNTIVKFIYTPPTNDAVKNDIRCYCYPNGNKFVSGDENKISITILEGDHTQNPPNGYIEGLKSVSQDVDEIVVSSVNENLLNLVDLGCTNLGGHFTIEYMDSNNIKLNTLSTNTNKYISASFDTFKFIPNVRYKIKAKYTHSDSANAPFISVRKYDNNGVALKDIYGKNGVIEDTFVPTHAKHRIDFFAGNQQGSLGGTWVEFTDIQISIDNDDFSYFTPYQSDKKPLLYYNNETQTWEKPILREWDSIEKHTDGKYYYHQRSGEVAFDGSEDWGARNMANENNTIGFGLYPGLPNYDINSLPPIICDRFACLNANALWAFDEEGTTHASDYLHIRILKSKLSTQDAEGFKQWLQTNNVTVVYQLAQEKVYECTNIDLITYANETNYIVESGTIVPRSTLKVHNNISNVVSLLQKKVSLLESNVKASQEVQDMMILETDMRMLDIELALMEFAPMKLNLGGSDMLRSATYFNFLKNHIVNETYEKEYLENVMNKYLATGRINQDEYDELYKMLYPPVYDIELPIEL